MLGIDKFVAFCKYHQALLHPVFVIQRKMKKFALGPGFWDAFCERHIELSKGRFVPIYNIMILVSATLRYFVE